MGLQQIPTEGKLKLKILYVISPVHYAVRLIEHKGCDDKIWKIINRSDEYLNFCLELKVYFSNENNHDRHFPINIGDLCVIKDDNTFYRCKVLEMKEPK